MFSIGRTVVVLLLLNFSSFIATAPTCHDTIPFSTKLNQSSLVVFGDIIETSIPLSTNNTTRRFNITFLVKCILKGDRPMNENILIEHSIPGKLFLFCIELLIWKSWLDDPICYRTLVNGYTYVFFLHPTEEENYYQQMPFHELLFNEDATVEILRRTCGIEVQPYGEIDEQCPIVSVGCE